MKRMTMHTSISFLTSLLLVRNSIGQLLEERAQGCRSVFRPWLMGILACWFIFSCIPAQADITFQDRRKDQFPVSPAHLVVPLPYSYPGIGEGFFLMGNFSNVQETTADFLAIYVTGDAGGYILQLDEMPIMDRHLYARMYYQNINKAVVNQYDTRGMDNTGENDYTLIEATLALEKTAEINLTFFDRRLNFLYQYSDREFEVISIRDHNGVLIRSLDQPYHNESADESYGINVDLTDDYLDPLKGIRFSLHYKDFPGKKAADPSFYVATYNLSYYLPTLEADTLVFNYFQSDAHVTKQGNTNPGDIRQELGFNCAPLDTQCLDSEQKLVDVFINERTNGSSASLGGKDRLRSYPQGRFQGGHSAYLGMEYRWNFKQEVAPFNYLFWKDVRTGLQVAFFAEAGSISEGYSDLWKEARYSYGTGLRLVAASGSVYRADLAYGNEGSELTVFFMYPW